MNANKLCKSRASWIFFIFCFFYVTLLINLYLIQIKGHAFYVGLGEKQYHVTVTQYPPRAAIYDRHGNYLALNNDSVAAFILPKSLETPQATKEFLAKHFPESLERLQHQNNSYFMYVKRKLTEEQIELIKQSAIADIKLLNEPSRFYPNPAAAQLVGVTDIDNKGLIGIELQFNDMLAGTPSTNTLEKDARSGRFYFEKQTMVRGNAGKPLTLTIDSTLQFLVHEELQATIDQHQALEGSALIMNPQTGEILAILSIPSFDPNTIEQLKDLEVTKNRAVTDVYELGSVIKSCAALSALEAGVVTLDEPIDCENKRTTYFEHRKINTVPQSVAGIIPFADVVAKSNNIGIAKVAKRVGTQLYDYYCRLGFGTKTGIPFPGEQKGFVNHPDNWSKQSIISLSYGYEITASLLQLARAFSIIANDGFDVLPRLVLNGQMPHQKERKIFSSQSVQGIKDILKKKYSAVQGYTLMVKTGTANTLIDGKYDPTKNRFTCAGIVEKDGYQRVIVAFINQVQKKNVYAATIAAPLLERLAKKVLIHDHIVIA